MFCESCGSQVPDGQAFCSNCGTPVAQPAQPAPQPAQPVQQYAQPVAQPVQQYAQPVQPVQYAQPVVAVPTQAPKSSNGMAIAGLIMGILTLVFCWVPFFNWILGLLGLIFSIVGLAKKNAGTKGCAIAGLIMTILGIVLSFVMIGAVLGSGVSTYLENAEMAASSIAAETSI